MTDNEMIEELLKKCNEELSGQTNDEDLKQKWADELLDNITMPFYRIDKLFIRQHIFYKRFKEIALSQKEKSSLYSAFINLIELKNDDVLADIKQWLVNNDNKDEPLNCNVFIYCLVIIMKQGFPGMWASVGEFMKGVNVQPGLPEMCAALETVYYSKDNDEIIDALSDVVRTNGEIHLAKELLGYTYYEMKMWKNALAYFEQISELENAEHIFFLDTIYFWMAWSYGVAKNYAKEEEYYRKTLEAFPESEYSLNNLGYSLYKQKRYDEAQEIFQKCLDEKRDTPYPANNMVRVLLAKGQYDEAVTFIKGYDGKINKTLIEKAEKFKGKSPALIYEDFSDADIVSENPSKDIEIGVSHKQFSSEKILEDELILRLEKGADVFALPLKVYEKSGVYGRQFIIPVGRIDILAVDDVDNIYVIELKKDSGYDDAYSQIMRYMEWIEENMAADGQKVYGIICLNSPDDNLIKKVRKNPKIKLFEYSISYNEIC